MKLGAKILAVYLTVLFCGQAVAVGIGLMFDKVSTAAGVAAFIPIYYLMYWVAWRAVLLAFDRGEAEEQSGNTRGGSRATTASFLLAPATLVLELAD